MKNHRIVNKILAIGDCNTLGSGIHENNSFPERVAEQLQVSVHNAGHTMSTTREGIYLLRNNVYEVDCVLIQFGLVDSYKTFKYSPYVLYYPETATRKLLRNVIKKYKKTCRNRGLNKLIGEKNVVPIIEYENNLRTMISYAAERMIILIDTVPNKQLERNEEIKRYNAILDKVARDYSNCFYVKIYDLFEENIDIFYADRTHCNDIGYDIIAKKIISKIRNIDLIKTSAF